MVSAMTSRDTVPTDGPVWTIVLAAGSGRRFGMTPKQYEFLGNDRVIDHSLAVSRAAADHVVVVLAPGQEREGAELVEAGAADVAVTGGSERADSVRAALAVIAEDAAVIVVHDAARPLASGELHQAVVAAVHAGADAAIPAIPVTDTIKRIAHDQEGRSVVAETPDRSTLVAVQTPQAFRADILRDAHASSAGATDDAALVEAIGGTVIVIDGESTNIKITGPNDLAIAAILFDALG
jgi:2-C-methyl-D-erythritol 4-phosphate cytidylyltransferase